MARQLYWTKREEELLNRRQSKGRFNRSQARQVKRELHRLAYS